MHVYCAVVADAIDFSAAQEEQEKNRGELMSTVAMPLRPLWQHTCTSRPDGAPVGGATAGGTILGGSGPAPGNRRTSADHDRACVRSRSRSRRNPSDVRRLH